MNREHMETVLVAILLLVGLLIYRLNTYTEGFKSKKERFSKSSDTMKTEIESYGGLDELCSAIEVQDRIKEEQIKLEKTKQYYLKAQEQRDEIDRLERQITKLMEVRDKRTKSNDMLNVARFEKQSEDEQKLRQKMLDQLKSQKTLDVEFNLQPYKAEPSSN
jgi:hypothetical protein